MAFPVGTHPWARSEAQSRSPVPNRNPETNGESPAVFSCGRRMFLCGGRRGILVKHVCNSLPSAVGLLLKDGDVLAFLCKHLLGLGVCEGHGVGTLTVVKFARLRSIHF